MSLTGFNRMRRVKEEVAKIEELEKQNNKVEEPKNDIVYAQPEEVKIEEPEEVKEDEVEEDEIKTSSRRRRKN